MRSGDGTDRHHSVFGRLLSGQLVIPPLILRVGLSTAFPCVLGGIKLLLNWCVIVCYRLVSFGLPPTQCLIICMGRGMWYNEPCNTLILEYLRGVMGSYDVVDCG